eukprot:SAG31_NODE_10262_length_1163_cov_1.505639_1_plen_348_part_01
MGLLARASLKCAAADPTRVGGLEAEDSPVMRAAFFASLQAVITSAAGERLGPGCRYQALAACIWLARPGSAVELSSVQRLLVSEFGRSSNLPGGAPLARDLADCLLARLRYLANIGDVVSGNGGAGTSEWNASVTGTGVPPPHSSGSSSAQCQPAIDAAGQATVCWVLDVLVDWCAVGATRVPTFVLLEAWELVLGLYDARGATAGGGGGGPGAECVFALLRAILKTIETAHSSHDVHAHQNESTTQRSANGSHQVAGLQLQILGFSFLGDHGPALCAAAWDAARVDPTADLTLRLQHSATFAAWPVRLACVQALGKLGKGCYFLVFVQLFEKYGTLIERYTALIEKV